MDISKLNNGICDNLLPAIRREFLVLLGRNFLLIYFLQVVNFFKYATYSNCRNEKFKLPTVTNNNNSNIYFQIIHFQVYFLLNIIFPSSGHSISLL